MRKTNDTKNKKSVGAGPVSAQEGITLIALIITIIIMLILVAVTINMAVNGGLFEKAGKAAGETQNAVNKEQELSNGKVEIDGVLYDSTDDYINGILSVDKQKTLLELYKEGILEIGDYIDYEPDSTNENYNSLQEKNGDSTQTITKESLRWRVLGTNNNGTKLLIISETPTTQMVAFSGAAGYNNAENELNNICQTLYSNSKYGSARSIKIEDIEEKSNFNYTEYSNENYHYGDSGTPLLDIYYPDIDEEEGYVYGKHVLYGDYYGYNNFAFDEGDTGYLKDVMSCEILLGNEAQYSYWVANKCVWVTYFHQSKSLSGAEYNIRNVGSSSSLAATPEYVYDGGIGGKKVYDSSNTETSQQSALRPVVELYNDCYLNYEKCGQPSYHNAINY